MAVAIYLLFLYSFNLPSAHFFYDSVGVRDAGTILTNLTWQPRTHDFWPRQVLLHLEGPGQWLALNLWTHAVGDLWPLEPTTTYFPQALFALGASVYAYLIGRRLHSPKLGMLMVLLIALAPWMAISMRRASLFMTMSCCFQAATFHYFLGFVQEPGRRVFRIGAPVALLLYLGSGLDWPAFLLVLLVFLLVSRGWRATLANPWMLLPGGFFLGYVLVTAYMWSQDMAWQFTLASYPFYKFLNNSAKGYSSPLMVIKDVLTTFGPGYWLALGGFFYVLWGLRPQGWLHAQEKRQPLLAFLLAVCLWFGLFSPPFMISGAREITYGYVLGLPLAVLAGLLLVRLPVVILTSVFVLTALFQWYEVTEDRNFVWRESRSPLLSILPEALPFVSPRKYDDRRVLAMSAYLNEKRPDLLARGKTAFLPRNQGANVGSYARGQNAMIVMPVDFPATGKKRRVGSDFEVLRDFVDTYRQQGRIKADWLVISSDELASTRYNSDPAFYRQLLNDPQVSWSALFEDEFGRRMWLGEVGPGGKPLDQVEALPVKPWADLYRERYDRLSFLKRNVEHVFHY